MSGMCPTCQRPPERQRVLTGTLWSECENGHVWNEDGEMATAQHNVFGENVPERVALDGGDA